MLYGRRVALSFRFDKFGKRSFIFDLRLGFGHPFGV
jgi:hypothetical protein